VLQNRGGKVIKIRKNRPVHAARGSSVSLEACPPAIVIWQPRWTVLQTATPIDLINLFAKVRRHVRASLNLTW
jgi:hypothetical protein